MSGSPTRCTSSIPWSPDEAKRFLREESVEIQKYRHRTNDVVRTHLIVSNHIRRRFDEADHMFEKTLLLAKSHRQYFEKKYRTFDELLLASEPCLAFPELGEFSIRYFRRLLTGPARESFIAFQEFFSTADRECDSFARQIGSIRSRFEESERTNYDVVKSSNSLLLSRLSNLFSRQGLLIQMCFDSQKEDDENDILNRTLLSGFHHPDDPPSPEVGVVDSCPVEIRRNHEEFCSLCEEINESCISAKSHFRSVQYLTEEVETAINRFVGWIRPFVSLGDELRACFCLPLLLKIVRCERQRRLDFHVVVRKALKREFLIDAEECSKSDVLREVKSQAFSLLRLRDELPTSGPFAVFYQELPDTDTASSSFTDEEIEEADEEGEVYDDGMDDPPRGVMPVPIPMAVKKRLGWGRSRSPDRRDRDRVRRCEETSEIRKLRTRLNLREAELRAQTHSNLMLRKKLAQFESSESLQISMLKKKLSEAQRRIEDFQDLESEEDL